MVASFSKFRLGVVEEEGVVLISSNIKKYRKDCERSLMGKIWGTRSANFTEVKNIFIPLWGQKGDIRVEELGTNFF